jgi:hypothetical protein
MKISGKIFSKSKINRGHDFENFTLHYDNQSANNGLTIGKKHVRQHMNQ